MVIHAIMTGDGRLFRDKLPTIPFALRQYLELEVERLMSVGAIYQADRCLPLCFKNRRLAEERTHNENVIDYCDVNAQTEKDSFPLPRIEQVWPTLSRARFFASLDLLMGLYQNEVEAHDSAKTTFLTHRGFYVYNVMPFRLCNAPATLQRLMKTVLGKLIRLGVLVYIYDVLIYAETPEQLIKILFAVLKQLVKSGLKCTASKCSLCTQTINYLGRVVSTDGINPDPVKLDKI